MKALDRVLKAHSCAYLCVPFGSEHREYPSVTDPKERGRLFGQDDHVRLYTRDVFIQRLNEAGFDTSLISEPSSLPAVYNTAKILDTIALARKIPDP